MRPRLALAGVCSAMLWAGSASAQPDAAACADAFEAAQLQRRKADFPRARRELDRCKSLCPAELVADCTRWQSELESERPVVTFSARDARGNELGDVSVSIDGKPQAQALASEVVLDPGSYRLRFVHPERGAIEQRVTLTARQRREVVVVFADEPARPPVEGERPTSSPSNVPWILGGIGLAAAAVGAGLAIKGHVDLNEYERTCSPNCSEDQADGVRRTWVAGAVTGAVGGALIVTSVVLLLTRDSSPERDSAIRFTPPPAGYGAGMAWSF